MIEGVKIFDIKKNCDDRGFLSEIAKTSLFELADGDGIAKNTFKWKQVNYTVAHPGVIKAFHWHKNQQDLWFCTHGNIQTVLYDRRLGAKTSMKKQVIIMGEQNNVAVLIPRGVAHGYRVLGNNSAGLIYLVDQEYNPENPDEQRINFDDPYVGFDWETKPR